MSSDSWSRERKIQLFERLFQGRPDVFPGRWENAKGRSGWAPCCANEWRPGVCEKPQVKCGQCPNQAFIAPAGHELRAHLEGHHAMGVYPLLADDTCHLLAIDLDGHAWREDVTAIREACEELAVQPAVERSRSGQGAHVWIGERGAGQMAAERRRAATVAWTPALIADPSRATARMALRGFGSETLPLPFATTTRKHHQEAAYLALYMGYRYGDSNPGFRTENPAS